MRIVAVVVVYDPGHEGIACDAVGGAHVDVHGVSPEVHEIAFVERVYGVLVVVASLDKAVGYRVVAAEVLGVGHQRERRIRYSYVIADDGLRKIQYVLYGAAPDEALVHGVAPLEVLFEDSLDHHEEVYGIHLGVEEHHVPED